MTFHLYQHFVHGSLYQGAADWKSKEQANCGFSSFGQHYLCFLTSHLAIFSGLLKFPGLSAGRLKPNLVGLCQHSWVKLLGSLSGLRVSRLQFKTAKLSINSPLLSIIVGGLWFACVSIIIISLRYFTLIFRYVEKTALHFAKYGRKMVYHAWLRVYNMIGLREIFLSGRNRPSNSCFHTLHVM